MEDLKDITWVFNDDKEIIEHVNMLVREYACADDSELSEDAIELKKLISSMVDRWSRMISKHKFLTAKIKF